MTGELIKPITSFKFKSNNDQLSKIQQIFMCSVFDDYREVEWCLPILKNYKDRGIKILFLLPSKPQTERQKIIVDWLSNYVDNIIYFYSINFLDIEYKIPFNIGKFNLKNIIGFKQCHILINRIISFFHLVFLSKRINLAFVPDGIFARKFSFPGPKWIIYNSLKINTIPIIGYHISTYETIKKVNHVDYLLVFNESDRIKSEKLGIPATIIGAPRFKKNWVLETTNFFSKKIISSFFFDDISNHKGIALVMLKNRTGLVTKLLSESDQNELRQEMLLELINNQYKILIKPHPGEKKENLLKSIETLPSDSYIITEVPALYLSYIADVCVFELPSNGIMDCLACDKIPFWILPSINNKIKIFKEPSFVQKMIKIGFPKLFFEYAQISTIKNIETNKISPEIKEKFRNDLSFDINLTNSITRCEQYFMG